MPPAQEPRTSHPSHDPADKKVNRSSRILYIPGKNPKPHPQAHREQLWRCLVHGITRADPEVGREVAEAKDCFEVCAWNSLYYSGYASLEPDLPWIDALLETTGASDADKQEALSWHKTMIKFMYGLGDYFHRLLPLVSDERVRSMIEDTTPISTTRKESPVRCGNW